MELVSIMYKYINRFINADKLINMLKEMDLSIYSKEESKEISNLIVKITNAMSNIPNEIDEEEINRLSHLGRILETFENFDNEKYEKNEEDLNKMYQILLRTKEQKRDCSKLYDELSKLLTQNMLVNKYLSKMSDIELLDFIKEYISSNRPIIIDQDRFNRLANIAIEGDKRETLWRLAFNYVNKNKNFSLIEDYFIEKRDTFYLTEYMCAVEGDYDKVKLTDKIMATRDIWFISSVANTCKEMGLVSEEEIKEIKEKYNFEQW